MTTTRQRLLATLVELQQELAELDELDGPTRERLRTTLADIHVALAGDGQNASARQPMASEDDTTLDEDGTSGSLAERLNDATRGLESTHPELSTALGGVINALGQMGI